ncbi:glycoside hydrolase family 29 protein [Fistulina hepatica ATCC 64428]|nr:glycoside hydrolase family 29 protein [Fistulina hepatica ATCC 64428]
MYDGEKTQAVQVTVANLLPSYTLSRNTSISSNYTVHIIGDGITTVEPGRIRRLVPGDQSRVDVFVRGSQTGVNATIQIYDETGTLVGESEGWQAAPLIEVWEPEESMLATHQAPSWWKAAKFGIMVHWGIYSVPAWAPNKTYAEWYNWYLHSSPGPSNPFWDHHLETYGPDVLYDDFIANFTATKFNASAWIDLFDRAGAKYFVFVTKHHDGFSLFDTKNTTNRSSVVLGPGRDFVRELMDANQNNPSEMHGGTYYSLPEWFNPYYAKYGFSTWPGGLAHDAFNSSELEPYTGLVNITDYDYINDLQYPHMLTLVKEYNTDIMWCDIGGPNRTLEVAAEFYTYAYQANRQVTINNRCAAVPDFDTPEYETIGVTQTRDWETNEGMDPFSYGLNSATTASEYKNGTTIVRTLVDVASKNGNYLLDVGPTAEGEIIPAMTNGLLETGDWLSFAGPCIYNTTYWFPGPEDVSSNSSVKVEDIRFLTTTDTFCIVSLGEPSENEVTIYKRLPLLPDDSITLLTKGGPKGPLNWTTNEDRSVTISMPDNVTKLSMYAWAFQVTYV